MKISGLLFFISTIILFSVSAFSQDLHFTNYTTKDGLSNNKVNAVLQDKSGFLWFGTDDGLNRFDGYEFKVYRNDPDDSNSISSNNIWSLFEDKERRIWIGTKSGELNRYDPEKNEFEHWKIESENISENSINELYVDDKGIVWIGTYQSGLYRFNIKTKKLDNWNYRPGDPHSLSNNFVIDIAEDSNGFLWISTYNGLNKFNPKSNDDSFLQFYSDPENVNSLSSNLIWSIHKSKFNPDLMWLGTADGLVALDIRQQTFSRIPINTENILQFGYSIGSVLEENINGENILWLGTYGGLVRCNTDRAESKRFVKKENDPASIISNKINKLIKDRSGVIWMATENGISSLSKKGMRFNNIFNEHNRAAGFNELFNNNIKSIAQNHYGNIFLGTSKGIYNYDISGKKISIQKYRNTDGLNVWCMTAGSNGNLWIGTYGQGLKQLNSGNGSIISREIESPTFKTSAYEYIKSLCEDNNNNLWIGFWGGGLGRLNIKNGKYKIWIHEKGNNRSISHNDVWAIYQDSGERMWIGTNGGGLNLFDSGGGGKFYHWAESGTDSLKLCSNSIYSICEGKKAKNAGDSGRTILWIGTSSGLNKLIIKNNAGFSDFNATNVEVFKYTIENGLADNSIKSIAEDDNGNLWIGTNSGISFFDVEKNIFANYSTGDGLNGYEFNFGSACFAKDGKMYFGSLEGINVFDPKHIELSYYTAPVVITDFQIFNRPVKTGISSTLQDNFTEAPKINLAYSQNVFSFRVAALDYNFPGAIQYAYKMEGFDKDWVYPGSRRFITYTNLGSGEYVFKFKATNSDGVWNKKYSSLIVNISSPWWRTTWSYIFYVLLTIGGVFTLRKFELNRTILRNKLKIREFEVKKQRELELIKSRFFAHLSHEFRTPLTLIRGPIEELINGTADNPKEYYQLIRRNSEKLQALIDQLLELTRLENAAIPLNAAEEDLVKLTRGLFSSFESLAKQKNISMSFKSNAISALCFIDRDKLEKIINNLLSNALKFTPENGSVEIEIKTIPDKYAELSIRDNGIGIPYDKLDKIFDRFYRVDDSSHSNFSGSGIGLALVKELVDLHKWEIDVKSKQGAGTEFILKIPSAASLPKENEKEIQPDLNEIELEKEIKEKNKLLNGKPKILIVEDSADVRTYLKSLLKNDYQTYEALNGEEGLQKSADLMPDLIISDVMMPLMDGIELCRQLKTNIQISHIPVILLTAKASTESKLEGLETGADDYLTKPFSSKELFTRIKNLLEQRKKLRDKFIKEIKIDVSTTPVTSLDNEFLQKALDIAKKNLSNFEFNSDTFAKEMFFSRSQFHRKLIAITGQAPGEFLRNYRLKRAASLILEKKLSLTQIAYEVGFSSSSHFAKAFQKQFNCLPSEFSSTSFL